jgi:hypothetical protein
VRIAFVVVLEPSSELAERGDRIQQGVDTNIVALQVLTELSDMPFDSWLWTGVKQAMRSSAAAKSRVSLAV